MIKSILRLLAASTSFVALLLITNSATAVALEPTQIELPQLSLNIIGPTLQLASDRDRTSLDHLGCSCGVCTQQNALVSNKI